MAVLLVYSACDSGVDILDDRIDTPPGDGDIGVDVAVNPLPPTDHASVVVIKTLRQQLIDAIDSSGVTEEDINAFEVNNDLTGVAQALGMTADQAEEKWQLYQTHIAILEAEFGIGFDKRALLPDSLCPDPPGDGSGYATGPCEDACSNTYDAAVAKAGADYQAGADECDPDSFWDHVKWPFCMIPHWMAHSAAMDTADYIFNACIVGCKIYDDGDNDSG